MASKPEKEKKDLKKSVPEPPKETPGKATPKSKKKVEEDEDDDDEDVETTPKTAKASPKSKKDEEEDDDDIDDEVDEVDEWDKVEEEEEWDPDFDEFDIPKSKTKKSTGPAKKTGKGAEEEDLGLDEEFKDLDLFNEGSFDEEEDDF